MLYPVEIQGCEGQKIEVRTASFAQGLQLLANGQAAAKGPKPGQMLLKSNRGQELVVQWKHQLLGLDLPQLLVDGRIIRIVEPLKWYAILWCALPAILILQGGALGGMVGSLGAICNIGVLRTANKPFVKILANIGITLLCGGVYFVLAGLISLWLKR